jgi:hypothetical protein
MKKAGDFLSRFKNLTPPDAAVREAVAEAVSTVAGVPISKKNVSIAHGVAFVKASSVAKSAMRLRRADILEHLFHELPKARDLVRDVR